ncbi:MAG: hypothetical protein ACTSQP_19720 [Promethearchaeota archaeon]
MNHPKTEIFWKSTNNGEEIYINETFIKIAKKIWYLIVFLNDKRNVLALEIG